MTTTETLHVRVWVPDVWDNLAMTVSPDTQVSQLKADCLTKATRATPNLSAYLVKYRGARVLDESQTMADLSVPDGAPFIILPVHRRPVT